MNNSQSLDKEKAVKKGKAYEGGSMPAIEFPTLGDQ